VLLAQDEASLYLQASLMRVFAPVGQTPVIRTDTQRHSTHFYGALNLLTGRETVLRSDLMTAEATALFLQQVLDLYAGVPILMLWDRATWHYGPAIRSVLEANPRLELLVFPPGCPELNPQEHVWKAARTVVSHNHSYAKLPKLAQEFELYLAKTCFPCSLLEWHGYDLIRTYN
jgi:transposase